MIWIIHFYSRYCNNFALVRGMKCCLARAFVQKVTTDWRTLSAENARPENQPRVRHYNAYNERIDRIIRSSDMQHMEQEIFGYGLFSHHQLKKMKVLLSAIFFAWEWGSWHHVSISMYRRSGLIN